jgi:hypothetical protein
MRPYESYILRIDTADLSVDDIQERVDSKLRNISGDGFRVVTATCTTLPVGARTYLLYTFIAEELPETDLE